ncbi:response regulator transcription factor [Neptuniibacter sp. CAU 1671]|uniref:response regulator transcription factor n=1 Tax=Neptuniibacter sp. CAU 1671 TaxID=3032593 RepID=UPI0023DAE66D|nr:response regulator transcription factor [Neptuniibacter sp. CAU 1671]MDF2181977.1 response regulator transcription factor [Neptuniibacter sp. CAU 1671]
MTSLQQSNQTPAEANFKPLVLVIEDDPHIANLIQTYLEHEGFLALIRHEGEAGLQTALTELPHLVILDLMLPGMDGWQVLQQLREQSDIPVLMLTARGEERDRVQGFSLGADDYVVKPFSPHELMGRVKAILRRIQQVHQHQKIRQGNLLMDQQAHQVSIGNKTLALTPTEYKLLEALMQHPGQVLSRAALLEWINTQGEIVVDRVIDVHVGKLRRKLETDCHSGVSIETVRGIGYRLAAPGKCTTEVTA